MSRAMGVLAILVVAFAANASAAIAAPAQTLQESYEVFLTTPSSAIGSFEQSVAFLTASGDYGTANLPFGDTEAILNRRQYSGPSAGATPSVRGFVLTSGAVAAISVGGGGPIATVEAPDGLRAALYEIQGVRLTSVRGGEKVKQPLPELTPLDANGQPIVSSPTAIKQPKNPALETRSWEAPAPEALGVCQMAARRHSGFTAGSGSVISVLRPTVGALGRPFVTCANTTYTAPRPPAEAETLTSFMVLDAARPGAAPAGMPAMELLAGSQFVFTTRVASGDLVARRVPGAWLLVEGGSSALQRLRLLAHLSASVHLPAAPIHRHASARPPKH